MSNRVEIVRTEFKNIVDGESGYGFRLCDDYENMYSNLYEASISKMSDMALLREASELTADRNSDILVNVAENERGIYIDGTYYEWDEIKSIIG